MDFVKNDVFVDCALIYFLFRFELEGFQKES